MYVSLLNSYKQYEKKDWKDEKVLEKAEYYMTYSKWHRVNYYTSF